MTALTDLIAQRDLLNAEIERTQSQAKVQSVAAVRALMIETGVTQADLFPAAKAAKKLAVKFQDTHGNTWTGRGLKPKWLSEALKAGATLDSFRAA